MVQLSPHAVEGCSKNRILHRSLCLLDGLTMSFAHHDGFGITASPEGLNRVNHERLVAPEHLVVGN